MGHPNTTRSLDDAGRCPMCERGKGSTTRKGFCAKHEVICSSHNDYVFLKRDGCNICRAEAKRAEKLAAEQREEKKRAEKLAAEKREEEKRKGGKK